MGVNRWSYQFNVAYYSGVHHVFGKATIGAAGAPTLVTAQSRGITSITRTAAGKYRLVLDAAYPYLLNADVSHMSPSVSNAVVQLVAEDVDGSSPYIDFAIVNPNSESTETVPTGTTEVQTFTALAQASCVDGDYIWFNDNTGSPWAVAIDLTGSSAEPTGAIWTAIPAGQKAQADISGDGTDAEVMATIEAALNALTGFSAKFTTSDAAADGTMTVTWVDKRAEIALADPQQDDDAAPGTSITAAETTSGSRGAVSIAGDTIQVYQHNYRTGLEVKVYGSDGMPTGLTEGTSYYVIVDDADNIQLATSSANATAGTQINITADAPAGGTLTIAPQTAIGEAVDPASGDSLYFDITLRATDTK